MGKLVCLELENFKSYKGHQVIGPFHTFTSVIGPNGAGKSNLMDAISFVLGVRSSQLRSQQLKDLIYRGRAMQEESVDPDSNDDEPTSQSRARRAHVTAVYLDSKNREIRFTRTITPSGGSEYKLNGKTVTNVKYNEVLQKENILVKARNFLVFQGDVEAIASQAPKEITRMIEQISGSIELKGEYDRLKAELERATENSAFNFNKKKGINAEIKQYEEQKAEAEKFEQLQRDRENKITEFLLWKLFHIELRIQNLEGEAEEREQQINEAQAELDKANNALKVSRRDHARVHKEFLKKETTLKTREKDQDNQRPTQVDLEEKIMHVSRKLAQSKESAEKVQKEYDRQNTYVEDLQEQLAGVEKATAAYEASLMANTSKEGPTLNENELAEYNKKKEETNMKTINESSELQNLKRHYKMESESVMRSNDKLRDMKARSEQLREEQESLEEHKKRVESHLNQLKADLLKSRQELKKMVTERETIAQQEIDLNEKLQSTLNQLMQASADHINSEKEIKMKETFNSLKRIFPGVRGTLSDLCEPIQKKYHIPITVILGRNMYAVVVDNENTAIQCIQYMREQRAGHATFIPLDTIKSKPINDKYRNFVPGARLAFDCIKYDPSFIHAFQYACGNALVCDSVEIAKEICYKRNQEVKAVTLDGTVFHKSGMITGGQSGISGAKKFEEQHVDGLNRTKESLLAKLNELSRSKRRGTTEEILKGEISGLESRIEYANNDLKTTRRKLDEIKGEIKRSNKEISDFSPKHEEMIRQLKERESKIESLEATINTVEDSIFKTFCQRVNIANIREYEGLQLKIAQETAEKRVQFTTQQSKLQNQLTFAQQQLAETSARLSQLNSSISSNTSLLATLQKDHQEKLEEARKIMNEIERLRQDLEQYKVAEAEKTDAVNSCRKEVARLSKDFDKLTKDVSASETEIERLNLERTSIFRRCKLEEIALPLKRGSLKDVPMEDPEQEEDVMDLDDDDQPRHLKIQPIRSTDWKIEVNFSQLSSAQKKSGEAKFEQTFQEDIKRLSLEIERMAPNLKAMDRLDGVHSRLKDMEAEFDTARREAKIIKDKFSAIKARRFTLFNDACNHICSRIDQIYKDLTKSKASPLGGSAYLNIESTEEPYNDGVKYHVIPPMKHFRDMDQLSGGEKTMAALALLFAIHSYQPAPFFVLDEIDAALDNNNVSMIANYVREHATDKFQFIVISLKSSFYEKAQGLVGIYRDQDINSSRTLTLNLEKFEE